VSHVDEALDLAGGDSRPQDGGGAAMDIQGQALGVLQQR
jgi:hypothetical protein